jgi:hypothetical protein
MVLLFVMAVLCQRDTTMREIIVASTEIFHAGFNFCLPSGCHLDIAAVDFYVHLDGPPVLSVVSQQGGCRLR